MASQELILLYVILGLVIGITYGLRKVYALEQSLTELHAKVGKLKKR